MKPAADAALNPHAVKPQDCNLARLNWKLKSAPSHAQFETYWKERNYQLVPQDLISSQRDLWIEIGAGTGFFFTELAKRHPEKELIAIERCRMRAKRLVRKTKKSGLPNLTGLRGNAIPAIVTGIPDNRLERIYILYPCPWPKNRHCKNRWYLHPMMPHLIRALKPGGLLIWSSDQKFYIDEAKYICESRYPVDIVSHGNISPNPFNGLEEFPQGRTKFEQGFLSLGLPCFELIVRKR